jgi:hypothetical protein
LLLVGPTPELRRAGPSVRVVTPPSRAADKVMLHDLTNGPTALPFSLVVRGQAFAGPGPARPPLLKGPSPAASVGCGGPLAGPGRLRLRLPGVGWRFSTWLYFGPLPSPTRRAASMTHRRRRGPPEVHPAPAKSGRAARLGFQVGGGCPAAAASEPQAESDSESEPESPGLATVCWHAAGPG